MKSLSKYDIILFDLDGTISESATGIRYSLEKTIEQVGCDKFDTSNILHKNILFSSQSDSHTWLFGHMNHPF